MRAHDLFEGPKALFRLHPALDPNNYVMTHTLRDHEKWRAKTYVNNNGGEESADGLQNVGYIMISLVDNTIVPISRDDEHHMGSDLMYDLASGDYPGPGKKKDKALDINPSQFLPIWSYGQNYIYHEREIKPLLIALEKFLSYGGTDGILTGTNDFRGRLVRLSDFVKSKGQDLLIVSPGKLAPVGQRIYDDFKTLSEAIVQAQDSDDRIKLRPVFTFAAKLLKDLPLTLMWGLGIDVDYAKSWPGLLRELQKNNDLQGLRELFFGFHGIKNQMHVHMKAKKDDNWHKDDLSGIWGDVDLAIDMLARL